MRVLRARQPSLTRVVPHQANPNTAIPDRRNKSGGDLPPPPTRVATSISLSPSTTAVDEGQQVVYTVACYDQFGALFADAGRTATVSTPGGAITGSPVDISTGQGTCTLSADNAGTYDVTATSLGVPDVTVSVIINGFTLTLIDPGNQTFAELENGGFVVLLSEYAPTQGNPITWDVTGLPASYTWQEIAGVPDRIAISGTAGIDDADLSPYALTITANQAGQQDQVNIDLIITQVEANALRFTEGTSAVAYRIRHRYDPNDLQQGWDAGDASLPYDEVTPAQLGAQVQGMYQIDVPNSLIVPLLLAAGQAQNGWYDVSVSSVNSSGVDCADSGRYASLNHVYLRY